MKIKIPFTDKRKIEAAGHIIKDGGAYRYKGTPYEITDWKPLPDGVELELMELI